MLYSVSLELRTVYTIVSIIFHVNYKTGDNLFIPFPALKSNIGGVTFCLIGIQNTILSTLNYTPIFLEFLRYFTKTTYRVSMAHTCNIFCCRSVFHRKCCFVDQLSSTTGDNVTTQKAISVFVT